MSDGTIFSARTRFANFARTRLSGNLGTLIKRAIAAPRYRSQLSNARKGYLEFGQRYKHTTLYVAGLPKSGTTWLDSMLSALPGFAEVMPPEAVYFELQNGGTLEFEIPADLFQRLARTLSIVRLHAQGSEHNVSLLELSNLPYVVIYRDLRDVAVSHHFYVAQTPWHPEHSKYKDLSVQDGLRVFARDLLEPNVRWIQSWLRQKDSPLCKVITFEELRESPEATLLGVLKHFEIPNAEVVAPDLVERTSMAKLSRGGKDVHFRKGAVGDWANHFPPDLVPVFEEAIAKAQS